MVLRFAPKVLIMRVIVLPWPAKDYPEVEGAVYSIIL